jgi:hypothetical protein
MEHIALHIHSFTHAQLADRNFGDVLSHKSYNCMLYVFTISFSCAKLIVVNRNCSCSKGTSPKLLFELLLE